MRAVNSGNTYTIYDNSIQLLTSLPAQTYLVNFNQNSGFFLTKYMDIAVSEKMYGVHNAKLIKVMAAFDSFERNLGVILSGDKGIGKSSFAKLLAAECVRTGIPVIVVNTYIPGIAEYLASFDQAVMVLFDEFDKTFKASNNNGMDAQAEMLTLFDGLAQGKKMFVVTCNNLTGLNDFLVNRPGRFHYHFRFGYPTAEDIREYLSDKVNKEFHSEINKVVSFSRKIDLNYDCLRAIAFELNTGISFKEAILDLNIVRDNYNRSNNYICKLYLSNGEIWEKRYAIDMFSEGKEEIWFDDKKYATDCLRVLINPKELDYDPVTMVFSTKDISQEDIYIDCEEYYGEDAEARIKELTAAAAIKVELIKVQTTSGLHYFV